MVVGMRKGRGIVVVVVIVVDESQGGGATGHHLSLLWRLPGGYVTRGSIMRIPALLCLVAIVPVTTGTRLPLSVPVRSSDSGRMGIGIGDGHKVPVLLLTVVRRPGDRGRGVTHEVVHQGAAAVAVQLQRALLKDLRYAVVVRLQFALELVQFTVQPAQVPFDQVVHLTGQLHLLVGVFQDLVVVPAEARELVVRLIRLQFVAATLREEHSNALLQGVHNVWGTGRIWYKVGDGSNNVIMWGLMNDG